MLRHAEIVEVAADLGAEVRNREYVDKILAPSFAEEPEAWQMIIEVLEVVLHRRGFYIVPAARVINPPVPN